MPWCVAGCKRSVTPPPECNGQTHSWNSQIHLWNHEQENLSENTEKSMMHGIWFVLSYVIFKFWVFLSYKLSFFLGLLHLSDAYQLLLLWLCLFCDSTFQMCHQWVHPDDLWFVWTLSSVEVQIIPTLVPLWAVTVSELSWKIWPECAWFKAWRRGQRPFCLKSASVL